MSEPLPWLVYDAISFLEDLVEPQCRVLEIGSGNSTIWFLHRRAQITTLESDAAWAQIVESRVRNDPRIESPSHLNLVNRLGAEAIDFISSLPDQKFDIVLVDSIPERILRGPALRAARPKLKPGGFMILDNSDSPAHRDAVAVMSDKKQIRFSGLTPMRLRVSQTSFWQV
jgi:predicted O-methyltransferase YrrM